MTTQDGENKTLSDTCHDGEFDLARSLVSSGTIAHTSGSELSPENMDEVILNKKAARGAMQEESEEKVIPQLVTSFIESFELASSNRASGDKLQYFFQLFQAYIALLRLEYIRQGGTEFSFLPQMVFYYFDDKKDSTYKAAGKSVRRHFEDDLEPRGALNHGHEQQTLYLNQFIHTLSGLVEQHRNVLADMGQSADEIFSVLTQALRRDEFYNFRDASQGSMRTGVVFRTGEFRLADIVLDRAISSVVDLRTADEVRDVQLKLPDSIDHVHVDLFNCGSEGPSSSEKSKPTYLWFAENASGALGMVLRVLLDAPLPVLVHCKAGKDRTGVVVALLQSLCGVPREEIVRDYLRSLQGTKAADIETFLDAADPADPLPFLFSCGLSSTEISALRERFCTAVFAPSFSYFKSFQMEPGGPPNAVCRPFLPCEEAVMARSMFRGVSSQHDRPLAVIVTGLPGSGKSSLCSQMLSSLGFEAGDFVHLDMDSVRTFHCQYQRHSHRIAPERSACGTMLLSYEDLVPWFNDGTNIETLLYSSPEGVVQTALAQRRHFVLATVMDNERTLAFLRSCVEKHSYRLVLMGVHVEEEIAMQRCASRARAVGRHMPPERIVGRSGAIQSAFSTAARYVASQPDGEVRLYDNNNNNKNNNNNNNNNNNLSSAEGPGSECAPIFTYSSGTSEIGDSNLAALYGVAEQSLAVAAHVSDPQPEESSEESHGTEEPSSALPGGDLSARYSEDGFVPLRGCVDHEYARRMGDTFEDKLTDFAVDNGLTREDYLSVINKWPHCNKLVMDIMYELGGQLRHRVAEVLGASVAYPVGAVLFRKSSKAAEAGRQPTHAHQDISYARFPGSQLFRATTWVPLLLRHADALTFAKGSHRHGVRGVEDFLRKGDHSETGESVGVVCEDVVEVSLGDCLLFDARTWHASTPFPPGLDSLRLAIGIQWLTEGGLDGLQPGAYHRFPECDVPSHVSLDAMRARGVFGMDTAGHFLKKALVLLECAMPHSSDSLGGQPPVSSFSSRALAEKFSGGESGVEAVLQSAGCDVSLAQEALRRYVLFRRAAAEHFGEAQGTSIFKPLYEHLVAPVMHSLGGVDI